MFLKTELAQSEETGMHYFTEELDIMPRTTSVKFKKPVTYYR